VSLAISLCRKGEAPYAISVNVNAADYSAARLVAEILPRLQDVRDLLVPAEMRVTPTMPLSNIAIKMGRTAKPLVGKSKR
jgi:hypothetical protein